MYTNSRPVLKDYKKTYVVSNNGVETEHIATGDFITYTNSVTGGYNPGWREDVAAHRGASTPLAGEKFEWRGSTSGFAGSKLRGKLNPALFLSDKVYGDLIAPSDFGAFNLPIDFLMEARVRNRALAAYYNHCWSALRSLQGGVLLGEIREALSMIRNPAKAFRKGLNDYSAEVNKRLRRRSPGRPVNNRASTNSANRIASDTWLEYSFGWSPLLSDVKSGAQAIRRLSSKPHEYRKVSAQAEEEYPVVPSSPLYQRNIAQFTVYRYSIRRKSGYSCWIIGEVKCSVSSPLTMSSEVLGFTPNDFVPTVWELIPYSFLVDYFSNIGDVINAWSFPKGSLSWHNRSTRRFTEREILAWCYGAFNPDPGLWTEESSDGSTLHVTQNRTSLSRDTLPLGLPYVVFEVPGSSLKWINIAALANMRRPR